MPNQQEQSQAQTEAQKLNATESNMAVAGAEELNLDQLDEVAGGAKQSF